MENGGDKVDSGWRGNRHHSMEGQTVRHLSGRAFISNARGAREGR